MPFICPDCTTATLAITASIALPPDARSDEIDLQIVTCATCDFRAMAIYEASRRGAEELWHHEGYRVQPAQQDRFQRRIGLCPEPANPYCPCAVHRELGVQDSQGRWCEPDNLPDRPSFLIRL